MPEKYHIKSFLNIEKNKEANRVMYHVKTNLYVLHEKKETEPIGLVIFIVIFLLVKGKPLL